ncbi:MAG: hypothetical protein Q9212_001819, partial [Teloschistes hypoglaucus]
MCSVETTILMNLPPPPPPNVWEVPTLQHSYKQEVELFYQLLDEYVYKGRLDTRDDVKGLREEEQDKLLDEAYMDIEKELKSAYSRIITELLKLGDPDAKIVVEIPYPQDALRFIVTTRSTTLQALRDRTALVVAMRIADDEMTQNEGKT